jgi:hypothetical protein
MKLQEVILRAIAKKITWADAAEISGLSAKTMVRLRQRYEQSGYDGLYRQTHRKRLFYCVPLSTVEKVLALYQQSYSGLSARHFYTELRSAHDIRLSYDWVKRALEGAGLIAIPKEPPRASARRNDVSSRRHRPLFVRRPGYWPWN